MPDAGQNPPQAATVLIAEDELLIRMALSDYLREAGFNVLEAASVRDAQAAFQSGARIDVVLSDIYMPAQDDGVRLALWIGAHYPGTPVVLASGVPDSIEAAIAASPNIVGGVDKPYLERVVERRLREALAQRAERGA